MKNRVLLPIEENPPVQAYHYRTFPLCVAMGQGDHVLPWVYNQYVNIIYNPRLPHDFEVYMYDWWFTRARVFIVNTLRLEPEIMDCQSIDVVNFVKEMLERGYYIFGAYDEFYIPQQRAYQVTNHRHDYLLYGYDDSKNIFHTIGYTKEQKFIPYTIPQDAFYNALRYLLDGRIEMHCVRINSEFTFSFNLKNFRQDLYDYLHSTDSHSAIQPDVLFGLEAEKMFIRHFQKFLDGPESIDLRYAKTFLEHKYLMLLRVQYMLAQGIIHDESIVRQCDEGYNHMKLVFNLCVKYNITNDAMILKRIIAKMWEILISEETALTALYDAISS